MQELLTTMQMAWSTTTHLEIISTAFGLVYVIFASRENSWCWPAAFISTATAIFLFWDASLLMESLLNVYYLLMAIYGFWQWQFGGRNKQKLKIRSFSIKQHINTLLLIVLLTIVSGFLLQQNTHAVLPYLDSFTTWSAVITTWMVTQKILQNWLYWIVIDCASIYLFVDRELYLYALLFILYTFIAFYGYINWHRQFINQTKNA